MRGEGARAGVPLWFVPVGFGIGFIGALCGIGGGLFAGPLLHLTCRLPLKRAAATALLLVFATTSASTAAELFQDTSLLRWELVLPLMGGVVIGARAGFYLAQRLSERRLKACFCIVMVLAGLRILTSHGGDAVAGGVVSPDGTTSFIALLVGVGGGFVAPILGVGGGLLMVPGLFLAIDGLSFTAARATSLAGGVAASMRSIALHSRAGNIAFAPGLYLALGALGGAATGVSFTRSDGFVQAGRFLLAAILILQGIRFGRELGKS